MISRAEQMHLIANALRDMADGELKLARARAEKEIAYGEAKACHLRRLAFAIETQEARETHKVVPLKLVGTDDGFKRPDYETAIGRPD